MYGAGVVVLGLGGEKEGGEEEGGEGRGGEGRHMYMYGWFGMPQ